MNENTKTADSEADIWGELPEVTPPPSKAYNPRNEAKKMAKKKKEGEPKDPNDGYVDLDSVGLPWDERIHATPKRKNSSNGKWAKLRGVDDATFNQVVAELRVKHPEPEGKKKEDTVETFWAEHVAGLSWGVFYEDRVTPVPYKWDGKAWQPMTTENVQDEAESFLFSRFKSSYTAGKRSSCVDMTPSILTRLGKVLEPIKDRALFSVQGGFLEVLVDGSIRLIPHTPDLFVRNFIDAPIGPDDVDEDGFYTPTDEATIESRGLFGKLVRDSFSEVEVRRAFQEHIGDTLLPENRQETPFLLGNGGNGKSQWIVLAKGMHTHHAMADLSNLKGFNMANFIGCSILLVDEAEKKIDEQMFKRIFGGGAGVQVDRKFKTAINWDPDIKGMVALNEMPTFSEHSEAIQRRIRPYPMSASRHDKKDRVADIAKKILSGYKVPGNERGEEIWISDQRRDVLDWMLSGAVRVARRGGLMMEEDMPLACQMEKAQLRTETEPVWAFIEDMDWRPANGTGGVSKLELYEVYVLWSRTNGKTGVMNSHRFGRDFRRNWEKKFGNGSLKEGKCKVLIKGGGEGWKAGYKLKAHNEADFPVKYGNYVWGEEDKTDRDEKVAQLPVDAPAPALVVHKKGNGVDEKLNPTTGHFFDCQGDGCNCLSRKDASETQGVDPGPSVSDPLFDTPF